MLLVPLEDLVVFPNMNVTLTVDVGSEERVLLVPRHENQYASVGTVAEVEERPDSDDTSARTRELEREYRAIVEEILELRGDDGRIAAFVRSITEAGALADTVGYSPDFTFEQKVELLEAIDVEQRLELAIALQRERLAEMQ